MTVDEVLLKNLRLVHGRDTCDEAGRPLSIYLCSYHEGFSDGLEQALLNEEALDG